MGNKIIHNRTTFSQDEINHLPVLKTGIRSKWRCRWIELRQHPTNKGMVVSIGTTDSGEIVIAEETKEQWIEALEHGKVVYE